MSTAHWRLMCTDVPMNRIRVTSSVGGFHVQLGDLVLWVASQQHWEDIAEAVGEAFAGVEAPREVPARTDNVKPTLTVQWGAAQVAGACYGGDDE